MCRAGIAIVGDSLVFVRHLIDRFGHIVIDRNLHAHERVSLCAEHPLTHNLVDDTDIADGQIYRIVVEFPSPHTERNRMEKRNGCEGMMIL